MSHVQLVEGRPTRDILVTRSVGGDRHFSGFGKAKTLEYADCFLDPNNLPLDAVRVGTGAGGMNGRTPLGFADVVRVDSRGGVPRMRFLVFPGRVISTAL